ncbi:hypothetical protein [Cellulosimicrobium cellulans]|uniref:hypothetical protein n=1 Tax=Cellulosimicrobium cellulans TaxID=1710 RepID=UPI00301B304D
MSDDFSAHLRALVEEALPETPIDPGAALDVARRRVRRSRSRRAVTTVAVAAIVVTGAVTVPDLADDLPFVAAATPGSVELAPGIRAATSMVGLEREGGGEVYDTGIPAWGTSDRFLFTTTEDHLVSEVYVGGDEELALLREEDVVARIEGPLSFSLRSPEGDSASTDGRGVEAVTVAARSSYVTVSSPDGSWRLVVGVETAGAARQDERVSTHLVARDVFTGPDGGTVSNVILPRSTSIPVPGAEDFAYFAVVAHNTTGTAPQFAGTVSQRVESSSGNIDSWGLNGCLPEECGQGLVWSPSTGAATEELTPDATTAELRERLDAFAGGDPDAGQRECLTIRARADTEHHVARTDRDRDTQCRLDVGEATWRYVHAQHPDAEAP